MMRRFFLFLLSLLCYNLAIANQYIAIIDAGSTGSRLHLYEYKTLKKGLPRLKEIYSSRNKPGIDKYFQQPTEILQGLNRLFDQATMLDLKTQAQIPVYLLATGGMRFLPDYQQQEIYKQLNRDLELKRPFQLKSMKTITGEQEALFGWLAANDVMERLGKRPSKTFGLLDLGGASMEVAYAESKPSPGSHKFCMANRCYSIYTKSILDLGIEHSLSHIVTAPEAAFCYPRDYQINAEHFGSYNLKQCEALSRQDIQDKLGEVAKHIPAKHTFIATAGFYYTFHFFKAANTIASLELATEKACSQTTWLDLLKQHPNDKPERVRKYCFASALIAALLTKPNGIGLTPTMKMRVAKYYHHKDITWARGAAIYLLVN